MSDLGGVYIRIVEKENSVSGEASQTYAILGGKSYVNNIIYGIEERAEEIISAGVEDNIKQRLPQNVQGNFTASLDNYDDIFNSDIDIDVKNKFLIGDNLELMTPSGNQNFTLTNMINSKTGKPVTDAKGSGHKVSIELDTQLNLAFAIIMRFLDEGGTTRHPFAQNQQDK